MIDIGMALLAAAIADLRALLSTEGIEIVYLEGSGFTDSTGGSLT